MIIQKEFDQLHSLVEELNNHFGGETYVPVELVYQEYIFYIKGFGKILWDSDIFAFCVEEEISWIKEMCYKEIYEMLAPSFNKMLDDLGREILHNTIEEIPEIIEDFKL